MKQTTEIPDTKETDYGKCIGPEEILNEYFISERTSSRTRTELVSVSSWDNTGWNRWGDFGRFSNVN